MKKHISLLLAVCMLFTILPIGMTTAVAVETTSVDANLVFDMAIADTDADGIPEVTDESGKGWVDSISFNAPRHAQGVTNVAPALETIAGTETKVLTFGDNTAENINRTLQVNFKAANAVPGIAESNRTTVELWFKNDTPAAWRQLFAYGCNHAECGANGNQCTVFAAEYDSVSGGADDKMLTWYVDRAKNPSTGNVSKYVNETKYLDGWHHLVFTRDRAVNYWDEGANWGKWTLKAYIDGVEVANYTSGPMSRKIYDEDTTNHTFSDSLTDDNHRTDHVANTLSIGGNLGGKAFNGSIADFKIYNDIRTEEEIKQAYLSGAPAMGIPAAVQSNGWTVGSSMNSETAGKLELNFKTTVTQNMLDAISVTKADGTDILGAYVAEVSKENPEIAVVRFGKLPAGDYKINIGSGYKQLNTSNFSYEDFDGDFAFTLVNATNVIDLDFDETGYTANEKITASSTDVSKLNIYANANYNAPTDTNGAGFGMTYVRQEGEGENVNNYLSMEPVIANPDSPALTDKPNTYWGIEIYPFDKEYFCANKDKVYEDLVYVVKSGVRQQINGAKGTSYVPLGSMSYGAALVSGASTTKTIEIIGGTATTSKMTSGATATLSANENSWFEPMYVLRADESYSAGDWLVVSDVYDQVTDKYLGRSGHGSLWNNKFGILYLNAVANADDSSKADSVDDYIQLDYIRAFPKRLLSVLKTSEYTATNGANGTVKIAMSNDVDAASLETIKVLSGGTEISGVVATADNANRNVVLTAAKGLPAGTYTVDLSGVKDIDGVLIYDEYDTATFTVDDANAKNSFDVIGVTANGAPITNNGTMSADANEITIAFDAPVNSDSLADITFEKKVEGNTTAIKGVLIKKIDGNNVKLKFGRLDDGEKYILTVPTTVKSGTSNLSEELKYEITANLEWFIKTDFSELDGAAGIDGTTLAAHTWLGDKGIKNGENLIMIQNTKVMVEKDGEDTVLKLEPTAVGTFGLAMYSEAGVLSGGPTLDKIFIADKPGYIFVTDAKAKLYKVDESNSKTNANVHILDPVNGELYAWGSYGTSGKIGTYAPTNVAGAGEAHDASGAFDYTNIRVIMRSANDAANANNSTYTLYDMDGGSIQKSINHKLSGKTSTLTVGNRQRLNVATGYVESNDFLNVGLGLTEFSALSVKAMDVMDTTYHSASKTIAIAMSDDVDVASLSTIKVNDGAVEVNPSYNADSRTITLSFDYGIAPGSYDVDLSGVLSAHGYDDGQTSATFTVEDAGVAVTKPVFKSGDKIVVNTVPEGSEETMVALADATEITVTTTLTNAPETCVAFLAVYQGGRLYKVVEATIEDGNLVANATELPVGTKEVKLFIWESMETLKPLFKPFSCL